MLRPTRGLSCRSGCPVRSVASLRPGPVQRGHSQDGSVAPFASQGAMATDSSPIAAHCDLWPRLICPSCPFARRFGGEAGIRTASKTEKKKKLMGAERIVHTRAASTAGHGDGQDVCLEKEASKWRENCEGGHARDMVLAVLEPSSWGTCRGLGITIQRDTSNRPKPEVRSPGTEPFAASQPRADRH